jgi:hypothetical protein
LSSAHKQVWAYHVSNPLQFCIICSRSFYNPHGVTNPLIHFKFFQKKTIPVVENVIEKDRTPKHETSVEERPTLLWTSAKAIFHLIIWLQKKV